ncbi:MAG: hypothetical protein M1837_005009 [Sclerophora amabilis]|nr:MAG: hypothetical protein M1837_005009 [Sclerophora amabilis]
MRSWSMGKPLLQSAYLRVVIVLPPLRPVSRYEGCGPLRNPTTPQLWTDMDVSDLDSGIKETALDIRPWARPEDPGDIHLTGPSMVDQPVTRKGQGRTPKYRASCDACNEAKVRCSQTRPSCARCLKHDIGCVYGISLRAGKHRADSYGNSNSNGNTSAPSNTTTSSAAEEPPAQQTAPLPSKSPTEAANFPDFSQQNLKDWTFESLDFPALRGFHQAPFEAGQYSNAFGQEDTDLTDYLPPAPSSPSTRHPFTNGISSVNDVTALSNNNHHQPLSVSQPLAALTTSHDGNAISMAEPFPTSMSIGPSTGSSTRDGSSSCLLNFSSTGGPSCSSCTASSMPSRASSPSPMGICRCNELVIQHLSILPVLTQNQRSAFDVELVQSKEAISLCKRVLGCNCGRKDYTSILAVALLIARIISIFGRGTQDPLGPTPSIEPEKLMIDEDHTMSMDLGRGIGCGGGAGAGGGSGGSGGTSPRFSLGAYQPDLEEERKLKMELVWVQLLKVEGLVVGFRAMVVKEQQRQSQTDYEMAAIEKLAVLLEEKVQKVRTTWEMMENKA